MHDDVAAVAFLSPHRCYFDRLSTAAAVVLTAVHLSLVACRLCVDAALRPTAREICRSPFVQAAQPGRDRGALGLYTTSPKRTRSPFPHSTPAPGGPSAAGIPPQSHSMEINGNS